MDVIIGDSKLPKDSFFIIWGNQTNHDQDSSKGGNKLAPQSGFE